MRLLMQQFQLRRPLRQLTISLTAPLRVHFKLTAFALDNHCRLAIDGRSDERRVGKEGRIRCELYHVQKTKINKLFKSACLSNTSKSIKSITWHGRLA